ncbi:MAG: AAA domain-containing protein [Hyphomicrobium sp.]|nr:AAA domain-containing protein [Hyphomicrobium sp.]
MTLYVRTCPACASERPLDEDECLSALETGQACRFPLLDIHPTPAGAVKSAKDNLDGPAEPSDAATEPTARDEELLGTKTDGLCPNGHAVEPDDVLCLTCGARLGCSGEDTGPRTKRIGEWQVVAELPQTSPDADFYLVRRESEDTVYVLRHFIAGMEPDPGLYAVLERLERPDVARLIAHGRSDGRAYEVWEHVEGRTLGEFRHEIIGDLEAIEQIAVALIRTLSAFEQRGLRHGNLQPAVIRLRSISPPVTCVTDFASARIAEFDVEASRFRQTSRYMAPEVVAEASTAASDWWSLGIILLEMLTDGRCFEGVHDRAFLLHLVARGVALPKDLEPRWRNLLEGLLTRNHENRWRSEQALRWVDGESDIPTGYEQAAAAGAGPVIPFADRKITSPAEFAFIAAEEANWSDAQAALYHGRIVSWLDEFEKKPPALDLVKKLATDQRLKELNSDFPLALAIAALNPNLPLCIKGEFVTPTALLSAPNVGAKWLSREPLAYLRRLKRPSDHWLVLLADRAQRVRSRAKDARIQLDEDGFSILQLATSTAALEQRWRAKRTLFPDSDNAVLGSLIDRRSFTDEDLLLLSAAAIENFRPAEELLREAQQLANEAGVPEFDRGSATKDLARPRRDLADDLDARVPGFERCGRAAIDSWMDTYRAANRRMPLSRLLVVLAVPASDWAEPPHQDYVRNVVSFLERRVLSGIQRGPLVQMRATASVLDVTGLGGTDLQARVLDSVVSRSDIAVELPREAMPASHVDRLRALESKARTYRRDTGLDALFMAFPILTLRAQNDDGEKTRIAPVFLWPVTLAVQRGAAGRVSIGFDQTREVQLNPALETILGPEAAVRWQNWATDRLRDGFDSYAAVLRTVAEQVEGSIDENIKPVPQAKTIQGTNQLKIHASAAIFVAEFASQAIANDLRLLQQQPLEGTALEYLLRLRAPEPAQEIRHVSHLERYTTLEADPSQEDAVFRARHAPGLVVQGPPGTGKSQTIVNIIADCIGRNESVLVVCEKKAALDVVQKRLAAETLDHRVFRIENTQSDRKLVLEQLRAQVPHVLDARTVAGGNAQARRRQIATQLDAIEADLDGYHLALHATDDRLGLTYREVLAMIAENGKMAGDVSVPGVRSQLAPLSAGEVEAVISECTGLVQVWLDGGVSGTALAVLRPFATDTALAAQIASDVGALRTADENRLKALVERKKLDPELQKISCHEPDALGQWLDENQEALKDVSTDLLERASRWRSFFASGGRHVAMAEAGRKRLSDLIERLNRLAMTGPASLALAAVREWTSEEIKVLSGALPALRSIGGLFSFLKIPQVLRRRAARAVLSRRGIRTDGASCLSHAEAANFEEEIRSALDKLIEIGSVFGEKLECVADRSQILVTARRLATWLDGFRDMASRLDSAPSSDLWSHVEHLTYNLDANGRDEKGSPLGPLLTALGFATAVAVGNKMTLARAERLAPHLAAETMHGIARAVEFELALPFDWKAIDEALPTLIAFQTFRLREATLSPVARTVFVELESVVEKLRASASPSDTIAALLRREAATAWKGEIETRHPQLQRIRTQLDKDIGELERLDNEMRDINRRYLGHIGQSGLARVDQWARVWALGGPNQLRLRQVFDRGRNLGLLKLRPVWLVNPDVASRMLPMEPGLFDVVIFDEASQMRVVNALPALFRAKRAIISGDEKQLPPTNFFGTKLDAPDPVDDDLEDPWAVPDDDLVEDGADAEAGSASIDQRELDASERHIKDCDDLLTLASGLLPPASLDIHYRSAYRELIAFSNAAYYGGKLNVPVRRPAEDVQRAKPIEVRRVDGLYRNQTNEDEAAGVVDLLADLWTAMPTSPTVGVVTFNMKQAELIEARLQQRADEDRRFASSLDRERTRSAEGEDVGFFVKNLENVQGDERDWIVFSTTFGRDENGVFKRVFGALNQQGGERRLNVAVTRAKQKVVLVTSMPTAEISSFIGQRRAPTMARDYLQGYMRYAELVHEGAFEAASSILNAFDSKPHYAMSGPEPAADELVLQALEALQREGFDASLMPMEDAFSLDIAVKHPATGLYALGVEFDSPRHHLLQQARAREVWRPKLLARSGLTLYRIQSSSWVQNQTRERERLIHAARAATARVKAA